MHLIFGLIVLDVVGEIDTMVLIDLGHCEQKGEAATGRKRGFV